MKSWIGKRVLVTGGAGFIGANLVRKLVREKAEVFLIAKTGCDLWRLKDILSRVTIIKGDMAQAQDVERAVSRTRPCAIFHLATFRASEESKTLIDFAETNILGAVHLIAAAKKVGLEILVCAGSQLEYGNALKPHRESDLLQPSTLHGITKVSATMLFQYAAHNIGLPVVVLRLFHVYGPWESPKRLIPTAIKAALTGDVLHMTEKGFRRDYVFIDDVVEAFLKAVDRPDLAGEVFNIGSGVHTLNEDVAAAIEKATGKILSIQFGTHPKHLNDTTFRVADIRKARDILGWQPKHSLDEGLRETAEWIKLA